MTTINWKEYVDYIFCISLLSNNRLEYISNVFQNLGINIYDSRFFSFLYDNNHVLFLDEFNKIRHKCSDFLEKNSYYRVGINTPYIVYYGFNIYKVLKIAQHFNYERIILFEDDLIFLKDINYIIKAMDFIKSQDFDMCMCQTTFMEAWHGIKSYLIDRATEDLENNMFLRIKRPLGVYGGGMTILTRNGINKIVNYFENNNFVTCLDALDVIRDVIGLDTLFALKPLCIQQNMTEWSEGRVNDENVNMKLNEYI